MPENSRIAGEYKRLNTNMNVPPVDENLYVRSFRNRDTPCDTRLITFNNQNSKRKKPDITPRCSSLTTNCNITTADLLE